jgi:hypothetical protein
LYRRAGIPSSGAVVSDELPIVPVADEKGQGRWN